MDSGPDPKSHRAAQAPAVTFRTIATRRRCSQLRAETGRCAQSTRRICTRATPTIAETRSVPPPGQPARPYPTRPLRSPSPLALFHPPAPSLPTPPVRLAPPPSLSLAPSFPLPLHPLSPPPSVPPSLSLSLWDQERPPPLSGTRSATCRLVESRAHSGVSECSDESALEPDGD
eukprot:2207011-Pleurochrysis_carterae.AAC.2